MTVVTVHSSRAIATNASGEKRRDVTPPAATHSARQSYNAGQGKEANPMNRFAQASELA